MELRLIRRKVSISVKNAKPAMLALLRASQAEGEKLLAIAVGKATQAAGRHLSNIELAAVVMPSTDEFWMLEVADAGAEYHVKYPLMPLFVEEENETKGGAQDSGSWIKGTASYDAARMALHAGIDALLDVHKIPLGELVGAIDQGVYLKLNSDCRPSVKADKNAEANLVAALDKAFMLQTSPDFMAYAKATASGQKPEFLHAWAERTHTTVVQG